jgi:hypothetical protein
MYMHSTEVLLSAAFKARVCSKIAMGDFFFLLLLSFISEHEDDLVDFTPHISNLILWSGKSAAVKTECRPELLVAGELG